jgi:hypothetical protein
MQSVRVPWETGSVAALVLDLYNFVVDLKSVKQHELIPLRRRMQKKDETIK